MRIVIAVVVIVLLIYYWRVSDYYGKFLTGVWKCSEDFCSRAGLDNMLVTFGPDTGWLSSKRNVYVIMQAKGQIVFNQLLECSIKSAPMGNYLYMWITIDNYSASPVDGTTIEDAFPEELKVVIDALTGRMTWSDGEKEYAELFRDNEASDFMKAIKDMPPKT